MIRIISRVILEYGVLVIVTRKGEKSGVDNFLGVSIENNFIVIGS